MASPKRVQRVASVLTEEIAKILAHELAADQALVTVTGVDVSSDCLHVRVRISVYPAEHQERVLADLAKDVWRFQQFLNERLRMRPVPKVRFAVDRSEAEAENIEKALKRVEK